MFFLIEGTEQTKINLNSLFSQIYNQKPKNFCLYFAKNQLKLFLFCINGMISGYVTRGKTAGHINRGVPQTNTISAAL